MKNERKNEDDMMNNLKIIFDDLGGYLPTPNVLKAGYLVSIEQWKEFFSTLEEKHQVNGINSGQSLSLQLDYYVSHILSHLKLYINQRKEIKDEDLVANDSLISLYHLRVMYSSLEILWTLRLQPMLGQWIPLPFEDTDAKGLLFQRARLKELLSLSQVASSNEKKSNLPLILELLLVFKELLFDHLFSGFIFSRNFERYLYGTFVMKSVLSDESSAVTEKGGALRATIDELLTDLINRNILHSVLISKLRIFSQSSHTALRSEASHLFTQVLLSNEGGVKSVVIGYLEGVANNPGLCESMQTQIAKVIVSLPKAYTASPASYFSQIIPQIVDLLLTSIAEKDLVLIETAVLMILRMIQQYPAYAEQLLGSIPVFKKIINYADIVRNSNSILQTSVAASKPLIQEIISSSSSVVMPANQQWTTKLFFSTLEFNELLEILQLLFLYRFPIASNLLTLLHKLHIPRGLFLLYYDLFEAVGQEEGSSTMNNCHTSLKNMEEQITDFHRQFLQRSDKYLLLFEILMKLLINPMIKESSRGLQLSCQFIFQLNYEERDHLIYFPIVDRLPPQKRTCEKAYRMEVEYEEEAPATLLKRPVSSSSHQQYKKGLQISLIMLPPLRTEVKSLSKTLQGFAVEAESNRSGELLLSVLSSSKQKRKQQLGYQELYGADDEDNGFDSDSRSEVNSANNADPQVWEQLCGLPESHSSHYQQFYLRSFLLLTMFKEHLAAKERKDPNDLPSIHLIYYFISNYFSWILSKFLVLPTQQERGDSDPGNHHHHHQQQQQQHRAEEKEEQEQKEKKKKRIQFMYSLELSLYQSSFTPNILFHHRTSLLKVLLSVFTHHYAWCSQHLLDEAPLEEDLSDSLNPVIKRNEGKKPLISEVSSSPLLLSGSETIEIGKEEQDEESSSSDATNNNSVIETSLQFLSAFVHQSQITAASQQQSSSQSSERVAAISIEEKKLLEKIRNTLQDLLLLPSLSSDRKGLHHDQILTLLGEIMNLLLDKSDDRLRRAQQSLSNPILADMTNLPTLIRTIEADYLYEGFPPLRAYGVQLVKHFITHSPYDSWRQYELKLFELLFPLLLDSDSFVYLHLIKCFCEWILRSSSFYLWNSLVEVYSLSDKWKKQTRKIEQGERSNADVWSSFYDLASSTDQSKNLLGLIGYYQQLLESHASLRNRTKDKRDDDVSQKYLVSIPRLRCVISELIQQIFIRGAFFFTGRDYQNYYKYTIFQLIATSLQLASQSIQSLLDRVSSPHAAEVEKEEATRQRQELFLQQITERLNIYTGRSIPQPAPQLQSEKDHSTPSESNTVKDIDWEVIDPVYLRQSSLSILAELLKRFLTFDQQFFVHNSYLVDVIQVCKGILLYEHHLDFHQLFIITKRTALSLLRYLLLHCHETLFVTLASSNGFQLLTQILRSMKLIQSNTKIDSFVREQSQDIIEIMKELTVVYSQFNYEEDGLLNAQGSQQLRFLKIAPTIHSSEDNVNR